VLVVDDERNITDLSPWPPLRGLLGGERRDRRRPGRGARPPSGLIVLDVGLPTRTVSAHSRLVAEVTGTGDLPDRRDATEEKVRGLTVGGETT